MIGRAKTERIVDVPDSGGLDARILIGVCGGIVEGQGGSVMLREMLFLSRTRRLLVDMWMREYGLKFDTCNRRHPCTFFVGVTIDLN